MAGSVHTAFDLSGKVALVTGASQGLGRQFAKTLSTAGASVSIAARQTDKLDTLRAEIAGDGGRAHAVRLDVTDLGSIETAVAETEEALGAIDILVNNAGIAIPKPFLKQSVEDYDQVLDTNLKGCFFVAQSVAKKMVERERGTIINIASVLGQDVIGQLTTYCASKAGLIHLTKSMALELARYGIRVNAIAPGYIETPMNTDFFNSPPGQAMIDSKTAQRALGKIADLDGALLLLASDAGSYMTGSTVTVDGGFTLT